MAGCLGCGRGRLLAPSSLVSRRTCCPPPLHFRAAGEGDRAASLSSLLPATCFAAQVAVPSAEPARRLATSGDLLQGRNGGVGAPGASGEGVTTSPEFWILGCVSPLEALLPSPSPERVPRKLQATPSECSEFVSEPLGSAPGHAHRALDHAPKYQNHAPEP